MRCSYCYTTRIAIQQADRVDLMQERSPALPFQSWSTGFLSQTIVKMYLNTGGFLNHFSLVVTRTLSSKSLVVVGMTIGTGILHVLRISWVSSQLTQVCCDRSVVLIGTLLFPSDVQIMLMFLAEYWDRISCILPILLSGVGRASLAKQLD